MPLAVGAALEQALCNAIIAQLGYTAQNCRVMYDGKPPPLAPAVFVAVWSSGERESRSRTALDEVYNGIKATCSCQLQKQPRDRWLSIRRDLEVRMNAIRALGHRDSLNHALKNAANTLADLTYSAADVQRHVGLAEALMFLRMEPWQEKSGEWYESDTPGPAAVAQTAVFGRARHVQAIGTAI